MGGPVIEIEIKACVARRDFAGAFDYLEKARSAGLSQAEADRLNRYIEGCLADNLDYSSSLVSSDDDLIGSAGGSEPSML